MNSSSLQRYLHVRSVIIKFIFAALIQVVDPSFHLFYRKNRPHEQGVQPVGATGGGRGGRATQQCLIRGGAVPKSNPVPLYMPFLTEKVPLLYTLYRQINGTPFTYLI